MLLPWDLFKNSFSCHLHHLHELQALEQLSKAPPDQNSKARIVFVLKLLTMLFTTLDIARREDDQPESEVRISLTSSFQ